MTYVIRYSSGEDQVGEPVRAESMEEARRHVTSKRAELSCKAEIAMIFRLSPSGTEELEESRKLHLV
jgi:hypothetical protein